MRAVALIVIALLGGGCAVRGDANLREERLATLAHIARQCGLPPQTFELVGIDELHFKPDPNEAYAEVDCGLQKIKESGMPFRMGFVGNEVYESNLQ